MKTIQNMRLLSCRGAQKAQKSTITGRCSAPNSAELNK